MIAIATFIMLAMQASAAQHSVTGWLLPGAFTTPPEAQHAMVIAGQMPNATSSVDFTRASNDDGTPEMWTWRMNITDLPVPNRPSELGTPSANASMGLHVLNTQWQIDWPAPGGSSNNNQSFQSFLADARNVSVYFNTLRVTLPGTVAKQYPDQSDGSCAPVLGDDCAQSLLQEVMKGGAVSTSDLDGCQNTLSAENVKGGGAFGPVLPFNSSSNDNAAGLYPGDTLYFETTDTYRADNMSLLQEAEGALYVLAMRFFQSTPQPTQQVGDGSTIVLCQIVDKTAATGAASEILPRPTASIWVAAIVGALAAMWL